MKTAIIQCKKVQEISKMSSLNLILGIFIISSIYCIPVNGRNTNHTRNGKTYFLQLKNVGDGEIVYRPLWRKNLKHKLGKSTEEYEILGRLVQTVSLKLKLFIMLELF